MQHSHMQWLQHVDMKTVSYVIAVPFADDWHVPCQLEQDSHGDARSQKEAEKEAEAIAEPAQASSLVSLTCVVPSRHLHVQVQ